MDVKESIKYLMNSNQGALKKLIEDITEEESLDRAGQNINHIRWQSGHIAGSAGLICTLLGGQPDFPEQWHKLFGRGEPFTEDNSVYPTLADIKAKLEELHSEMHWDLKQADSEDILKERELLSGWNTSPAKAVLFLLTHEFYHAGQIATLRKLIGKPSLFG